MKITYYKGDPPHKGWWCVVQRYDRNPASEDVIEIPFSTPEKQTHWRWWDGEKWSFVLSPGDHAAVLSDTAGWYASRPSYDGPQARYYWSFYWPENARVMRQIE